MKEVDISAESKKNEPYEVEMERFRDAFSNVQVGIVEQAKKDYIKGALVLIRRFRMPMNMIENDPSAQIRIQKSRPGARSAHDRHIYWYKDARRFVLEDPYSMFEDSEIVLKAWNKEAEDMFRAEERRNFYTSYNRR